MAATVIAVISCSLNPQSRSRILARYAHERLRLAGNPAELVDLAGLDLPACDGRDACTHPAIAPLKETISRADGILLAFPIYNYDAGAAAKNLIELTGSVWEGKTVGMLAAAGGTSSYMAPMGLAQSLMLDFRCLILPRFVLATEHAFEGEAITDTRIRDRVEALASEIVRIASALRPRGD